MSSTPPTACPCASPTRAPAPERHATTYSYNKLGLVRKAHETGHVGATAYDYTLHGEQTLQGEPMGTSTHNAYDANGRLVRTVNAHGRLSLRTYDDVGNLTSLSQPAGAAGQLVTTYTYNARNEVATESDPADAAHEIRYEYDGEGRQRFRRDYHGGTLKRFTEQTYRSDGKLVVEDARFVGTENGRTRSTFDYDANGNPTATATYRDGATGPNVSTTSAAYTSANEIATWNETIFNPAGVGVTKAISYAYQQDGLLQRRTVDFENTTYTYTLNGLERTVAGFGDPNVYTNTYLPSGALASRTLPNGATWTATYDLADRLTSRTLRRSDGTTVLAGWEHLTYDDNDNRLAENVSLRQLDGTTQTGLGQYTYDKLSRLTTSKHPFEPLVQPYVLDDGGNVVTETGFVYTYTTNRLTRRQRFPQIDDYTTYDYDNFGNQTQENIAGNVAATNNYDAAGHTTSRNQSGFNIAYSYDALDRQVRRTDSSGDVTLFFRDGPRSQIALETDANGTAKTRYTLDSDGEAIANHNAALSIADGRGYYVQDPRGNLVQIINRNQEVVATFGYDDFGKEKPALTKRQSATWDSRLRFQMSPKDGITGQYAMGPRMYDPGTFRFISADQFVGSGASMELQTDPLTGNRYLYAGANPANLIDDGHAPKWLKAAGNFAKGALKNKVVKGVLIGVAVAAACGATAGIGCAVAVGAGAGAALGGADYLTNSKKKSLGGFAGATLGGGLEGALSGGLGAGAAGVGRGVASYADDGGRIIQSAARKEAKRGVEHLKKFMTPAERRAFEANPGRGSRFLGQATHHATARRLSSRHRGRFDYRRRGIDFLDRKTGELIELTTPGQVAGHQARAGYEGARHVTYSLP